MDCTMVAAAPVFPAGYVASASRIADRRMILAGYRLADLLTRVLKAEGEILFNPRVLIGKKNGGPMWTVAS